MINSLTKPDISFISFLFRCVCALIGLDVHHIYAVKHRGQKRTSDPLELELQAVVRLLILMLGIELSGKVVSTLNYCAISPDPNYTFKLIISCCYYMDMDMDICHLCLGTTCVPGDHAHQKRASDPLGLELQRVVRRQKEAGNWYFFPLEKQPVLLTTQPSLQYPNQTFRLHKKNQIPSASLLVNDLTSSI